MATLPKGQGVFLPPFKAWLASNIPAVYDNTMTYYEELVALIKYLQDIVVPAVNDNASAVTTISNAVEQLQSYVENYFANLDVQEEINNKLDQMAEDGQLSDIISQYLNSTAIFGYDTVADMKDADNLVNGSYARTLGYNAKNDGGSALYKIRTITNDDVIDGGSIISMNDTGNTLVAELISPVICPEMFGAVGDGVTDDTIKLQKAIDYCRENNYTLKCHQQSVFAISSPLTIIDASSIDDVKQIRFDFGYCTIKAISAIPYILYYNTGSTAYDTAYIKNELSNVILECNELANEGYHQDYGRTVKLQDVRVLNPVTIAIHVAGGSIFTDYVEIDRRLYNYQSVGIQIDAGATDSKIHNVRMRDMHTAIVDNGGGTFFFNVHAWLVNESVLDGSTFAQLTVFDIFTNCYPDTYQLSFDFSGSTKGGAMITGCYFYVNPNFYPSSHNEPVLFKYYDIAHASVAQLVNCRFALGSYYSATGKKVKFSNLTTSNVNNASTWYAYSYNSGLQDSIDEAPTYNIMGNRISALEGYTGFANVTNTTSASILTRLGITEDGFYEATLFTQSQSDNTVSIYGFRVYQGNFRSWSPVIEGNAGNAPRLSSAGNITTNTETTSTRINIRVVKILS